MAPYSILFAINVTLSYTLSHSGIQFYFVTYAITEVGVTAPLFFKYILKYDTGRNPHYKHTYSKMPDLLVPAITKLQNLLVIFFF